MAQYGQAAYFPMPDRVLGRNENADNGWGDYCWPAGVPENLRGQAKYGNIKVEVRNELIPLFQLLFEITELMGYKIHTVNPNGSGEVWGPWSYENRPIGGTKSASNHSRARAIDVNAPQNPQSYAFVSTWPPLVINAWEQCGFRWGGRYKNPTKFDTMHLNYAGFKSEVDSDIVRARQMRDRLRGTSTPIPTPSAPAGNSDGWPLADGHAFGAVQSGSSHNGSAGGMERLVVAEIQDQLNKLGFSSGAPDGYFGPKTRNSVLAWQKRNPGGAMKVIESGMIGHNDYIALHTYARTGPAPQAATPPFPGRLLEVGVIGEDVKVMQARLNLHLRVLGRAEIQVDGKFGSGTERAVLTYQMVREHTHNLGTPDGVVGPRTWNSLWN